MKERATHKVKPAGPGNLLGVKGKKTNNHHLMSTHCVSDNVIELSCIIIFNTRNASTRSVMIMFYRWGNQGTMGLSKLPQVPQQLSGGPSLPDSKFKHLATVCDRLGGSSMTYRTLQEGRSVTEKPGQGQNTGRGAGLKRRRRDFPGSPVVKTQHSQCRGHRSKPRLGNEAPASHISK